MPAHLLEKTEYTLAICSDWQESNWESPFHIRPSEYAFDAGYQDKETCARYHIELENGKEIYLKESLFDADRDSIELVITVKNSGIYEFAWDREKEEVKVELLDEISEDSSHHFTLDYVRLDAEELLFTMIGIGTIINTPIPEQEIEKLKYMMSTNQGKSFRDLYVKLVNIFEDRLSAEGKISPRKEVEFTKDGKLKDYNIHVSQH